MLRSYFIIAWRNIQRNKTYSLINILGLSLGVACCLLLALYVQDEIRYDQHHRDLNNLYRIITKFQSERGIDRLGSTSPPIAMTLRDEIPEVLAAARVLNPPGVSENLIKYKDKVFYETDGFVADSTLFDIFTYGLKEGNPAKALTDANTVVISESLAGKLFGNESALEKIISISQGGAPADFKITGVFMENNKSFLHANFFISMMSSGWGEYIRTDPDGSTEWAGQNFVPAYLKLVPGHEAAAIEKKMNDVLMKHGAEDMKALGVRKSLMLEPLKDIYLRSDVGRSPRITYLYVIVSIALFILLIGCINFMNLSTAKASKRSAEIGVRKVMGAYRASLIRQILGEAMLIVIISILISVVMVQASMPFFNDFTGKTISFGSENVGYFILALTAITLVTGLVAGSYPAFYLSSFQPAEVLKGKFKQGNSSGTMRQALVIFQFMIAIALGCGMVIISNQLNYMQQKNLGFDAKAKIILPLRTKSARTSYDALKKELQHNGAVHAVSGADYVPGTTIWSDMMYYPQGGSMDNAVLNRRNRIDDGYMELLGIKLIAGRTFTDNREMEKESKLILNRTSARQLGFEPEKIVGQQLFFDLQGKKHTFEVIGVMEDYHQTSLKEEINPIMFEMPPDNTSFRYLIADVDNEHFEETVASIEKTWRGMVNDTPFEYSFLDESLRKLYEEDKKVARIINTFTAIAMLISCLGLYGLSSYMAERRFKEIGVRKVMGASVTQIVGLMSKEFVKLVVIAFVLAVPLAWYAMNQWLEGFTYRVPVHSTVFIIAGVSALVIALLTISYESVRAAMGNPVESLRNE
jgi:putative ABC transport system permease protein